MSSGTELASNDAFAGESDVHSATGAESSAVSDSDPAGESGSDPLSAAIAVMATVDPAEQAFDELQYIGGLGDVEADGKATEVVAFPFSTLNEPAQSFKSAERSCFVPGVAVTVRITDYERTSTSHLLNPYVYTIECAHGRFGWTIRRRYKHFSSLHKSLRLFRSAMRLPFAHSYHRRRSSASTGRGGGNGGDAELKEQPVIPRMPKRGESMIADDEVPERMKQLEDYLNAVLKSKLYRNHHEMLEFLEVSPWSFVDQLGGKHKESMVKKRIGSALSNEGPKYCGLCYQCRKCATGYCAGWRKRWLIVKDSYITYVGPRDGTIRAVMLMDSDWDVNRGIFGTNTNNSLTIVNSSRNLQLHCWTKRKAREWLTALKQAYDTRGKDFVDANRYESFAPVRERCARVRWYVDGSEYFRDVADAVQAAAEQVFITDWWLSPEIMLKRPVASASSDLYWRLDKLLLRKAEEGVKVYVMLYKEVELALGINSFYSKQKLMVHENIKVIRHPDHASAAVLFWAHHEKLVVVDQKYAFVGGIDLCYGRWDDFYHRLVDTGGEESSDRAPLRSVVTSSTSAAAAGPPSALLALAQGANMVTLGSVGRSHTEGDTKDTTKNGTGEDVNGAAVMQLRDADEMIKGETPPPTRRRGIRSLLHARHVAAALNQARNKSDDGSTVAKVNGSGSHTDSATHTATSADANANDNFDVVDTNRCKYVKTKLWAGKDYANFIVKDFGVLDALQDQVDRTCVPRMPWHDIATGVDGAAARDVARHFIQRWNAAKVEKLRQNPDYEYLLPKSYDGCDDEIDVDFLSSASFPAKCQIVRSASLWSAALSDPEDSIQQAYVDAISGARHFIYIENQFFVSFCGLNADVHNRICEALFQRILRAHNQGSKFRVYIIIPLLPGFEGQVGTAGGTAIQAITHWNYSSLCRGKYSLLHKLRERGVQEPSDYVTLHGLRTHAVLAGRPVTELIYVHSKLMIVDDMIVVCGSANINDRSMLGNRDSEVCIVVQDTEFDEGTMNGQSVSVGKYAGSLRRRLFREHLGLLESSTTSTNTTTSDKHDEINVADPVCDAFYSHVWQRVSSNNTAVYEEVFRCIPTDQVRTFADLQRYQSQVPLAVSLPSRGLESLKAIKGFVVDLPLAFLQDENLQPVVGTKEGLAPNYLWT